MKRALLAACLGLAASACAEGYYGPGDYNGYGRYGGYSGYGVGGLAYYDDFYGPYYDGYWGRDGFYYYSLGRDRPFVRDERHHFRHDNAGGGFHGVQGHRGDRAGGHGWRGDHDRRGDQDGHDRR